MDRNTWRLIQVATSLYYESIKGFESQRELTRVKDVLRNGPPGRKANLVKLIGYHARQIRNTDRN